MRRWGFKFSWKKDIHLDGSWRLRVFDLAKVSAFVLTLVFLALGLVPWPVAAILLVGFSGLKLVITG